VIGFITPGAPAGLGVRESIMILILTNFIGQPTAAFVALISRLVVTIGDLVFFLFSYLLPRKLD
jgi:glycosyltransferase 2 family protein